MFSGIRVVYFVAQMGERWREVVASQVGKLRASGIMDSGAKFEAVVAGDEEFEIDGFEIVRRSSVSEFEYPALQHISETAKSKKTILYMHTKGVSRDDTAGERWRHYLMQQNIERWRDCFEEIKNGADVCGSLYVALTPRFKKLCGADNVFAGNFWWASGKYIQGLPYPQTQKNRWGAEGWVVSFSPVVTVMHNLTNGKPVTKLYPFGDKYYLQGDNQ